MLYVGSSTEGDRARIAADLLLLRMQLSHHYHLHLDADQHGSQGCMSRACSMQYQLEVKGMTEWSEDLLAGKSPLEKACIGHPDVKFACSFECEKEEL